MGLGLVASPSGADAQTFRHVRSDDASIRRLLREGYERSASLRAIVDDVDAAAGIVYIEPAIALSKGMEGALLHSVAGSPGLPILRVLIKTSMSGDRATAIIAHELQHVAEVLHSGQTGNATRMTEFFASLNGHGRGASVFETDHAKAMTERVLRELHGARRR